MKQDASAILNLARSRIIRPRDLTELEVPRQVLADLVDSGDLVRTARGLYVAADFDLTENHSLAEVAKRWPQAVVCLLSALQFHELSLELPSEVWIAVPRGHSPRSRDLRHRVVQLSAETFSAGVETHTIEGVPVHIYSAAKTVADCFRFRNRIGNAVAYEALKNAWTGRKATAVDIVANAKLCHVYNIMRPYLETLWGLCGSCDHQGSGGIHRCSREALRLHRESENLAANRSRLNCRHFPVGSFA
jgi:predicted transcriptional regulator of viral defense system